MTGSNEQVQRLLASLASYTSSNQSSTLEGGPPAQQTSYSAANFASTLPGLGGLPHSDYLAAARPSTPHYTPRVLTPNRSINQQPTITRDPRLKAPSTSTPPPQTTTSTPKPPVPDASSITDWPTAIRHVMTHLAPDPTFAARIRRLITTQHQYEDDWHTKRELITTRHASRDTSSAQLSSIFASLGVPAPTPVAGSAAPAARDLEAERKELEAYDAKVYKQLLALVGDFDRQLRGLGVPFYAIRHELVVLEEGKEREGAEKGRVDRGELRELQRRMLEWLEMSFPV